MHIIRDSKRHDPLSFHLKGQQAYVTDYYL